MPGVSTSLPRRCGQRKIVLLNRSLSRAIFCDTIFCKGILLYERFGEFVSIADTREFG